jgi:DNA-binding transcriptional LysR family regulator
VSESYDDVDAAATGGLESHLLLTEPLLLTVPSDDDGDAPVALAAREGASWIAGLAGTQYAAVLERACRSAGFEPRVVHRADDAVLVQALVVARLGIALVPALACLPSVDVRFAEVSPPAPRRHVWALARRGAVRRPALAATLDALRRRAAVVAGAG